MAFKKIKVWVSDLTSKVSNLGRNTFGNLFLQNISYTKVPGQRGCTEDVVNARVRTNHDELQAAYNLKVETSEFINEIRHTCFKRQRGFQPSFLTLARLTSTNQQHIYYYKIIEDKKV